MDISVIIVNYNTSDLIKSCIDSILRQVNTQFEVIVIDNASSDNSLDVLKQYGSNVKLIKNQQDSHITLSICAISYVGNLTSTRMEARRDIIERVKNEQISFGALIFQRGRYGSPGYP